MLRWFRNTGLFPLSSLALLVTVSLPQASPGPMTQEPAPEYAVGPLALPFFFERNEGQAPREVQFLTRIAGAYVQLTRSEAIFRLPHPDQISKSAGFRIRFRNASGRVQVRGEGLLKGRSHYFTGGNPRQWNAQVPHYRKVRYQELYPGIDLVFHENQGKLKYDFLIAPGADPDQIRLEFAGIENSSSDGENDLILQVGEHFVVQRIPAAYQEIAGSRRMVQAQQRLDASGRVHFRVSDYQRNQALILDPVLEFARFFGGSGEEEILSIDTDRDGNIYMTGGSSSADLPVTSPGLPYPSHAFETEGNRLAFVAKLDPTGTRLHYLTYLGGGKTSTAHYLRVDSAGNAYVAGRTETDDFPLRNPIQSAYGGGSDDIFLSKLSPDGASLIFSTYIGGSEYDQARSLALDDEGSVYLTGRTESSNFPTLKPILPAYSGKQDAFATKVSPDGSRLIYSTYLGGSENDVGHAITTDSAGNVYITGLSNSPDFPTTNSYQARFRGGEGDDTIVVKLNAAGTSFVYSTFLGGSADDESRAIAVDSSGNATITGYTQSTDFPTYRALQADFGGPSHDIFISSLNAQGTGLRYSTYLGGSGGDYGRGLAFDNQGNIYLTGYTNSIDFPTHQPLQGEYAGGEADSIIVKLNPTASQLLYSSFLGGSRFERGRAIVVDYLGNIMVSGRTESSDFAKADPASAPFGGGSDDAFIVKLAPE